jgi:light-regulated signal transduction histidine kinase (bacteriophytochrome)
VDIADDKLEQEKLRVTSTDEVGSLCIAFNQMLDGLVENINERKRLEQFSYMVSHDLKEPLLVIEGFSRRLKTKCGDSLSEQGREYLDCIVAGARRMQELISHLLMLSRAANADEPLVAVDLARTARDAIADLETCIQRTGGHVEVGDLPSIDGDPTLLRQLLQNLISNGLKYHGEKPPVVKVHSQLLEGRAALPIAKCRLPISFPIRAHPCNPW